MSISLTAIGTFTSAAAASITPAFGQSTTAGNLLVAWIGGNGSGAGGGSDITTASSGWVKAVSKFAASAPQGSVAIYYKPNCGAGETAPTFSCASSTYMRAMLAEYTGADVTSPLDQVGSVQGTVSPQVAAGAGVDAAIGNLILAAAFHRVTVAATATFTDTLNNGATATGQQTDGGTSSTVHTDFAAYGLTTSNAVASQDSLTFTATNISGVVQVISTFKATTPPTASIGGFFSSTDWPGPDDLIYRPHRPRPAPLLSSYVTPAPPPTPGVFLSFPFPRWRQPQRYRMDGPLMSSPVLGLQNLTRTITDTLSLTETAARLFTGFRNTTDTLSISDSVLKAVGKFVTETLSISDTVTRLFTGFRSATETLALSETIARLYTGFRSMTETLSLSESVARVLGIARSVTETLSISDSVARLFTGFRSATETFSLTETVARLFTGFRSVTETLSITDTTRLAIGKFITETLSLSETVARRLTAFRSLTETLTLTETVARLGTFFRSITDTLSLSESVVRGLIFLRSVTETLSISDTVVRLFTGFRTVTETLSIADTVARLGTFFRSTSETLTLSESVVRGLIFLRAATETLSISDTVVRLYTGFRSVTETLTLTETVARLLTAFRTLTETLTLSESVVRVKGAIRAVTETLNISDSVVRLYGALRTTNETLTLSETIARRFTGFRSATEALTLSEVAARLAGIVRALTDTLTLSDTTVRRGTFLRSLTETVILSDTVTRLYNGFRSVSETISGLSDSVATALNALFNPSKTFIAPQRSLSVTAPRRSMAAVGPIRGLTVLAPNRALTAHAMTYMSTVLGDNPVSYWRLGESTGAASYADSSGHGYAMTWNGAGTAPAAIAGTIVNDPNGAQVFTDQGGSLNTPYAAALHPTVFTYEFWLWIANGAIMRRVFDNGVGSDAVILGGGGTTTLTFQIGAVIVMQPLGFNDGNWHHVVWTNNGVTTHLYKDGTDITPAYTQTTPTPSNTPTTLGNYSGGVTCGMQLDEFAIYSYALSSAQVLAHYNAGVAASYAQSSTVTAPSRPNTFTAVPE